MKFGLVAPFYNNFSFTDSFVKSIRRFSQNYQMVLIDNGSDSDVKEKVKGFLEPNDILLSNEQNLGFAKAVNQGLQKVDTEFICILNNDVEVCEHWLEILEGYFSRLGGFVGPVGGNVSVNEIGITKVVQAVPGEVDYLGMACMFSSKCNFDLVGPLSEDYGLAYCEDTDYGMRILQKGLHSYIVPIPIKHYGGKTATLLNPTLLTQGENVKKFFSRWHKFLGERSERP